MDWTDNYCRKTVSDFAESMVKEIIREIVDSGKIFEIHKDFATNLQPS